MSRKQIKPLSREDQLYAKTLIRELDEAIRRTVRSYLGADLSSEFEDIVQSIYEEVCTQLDDFKSCNNPEAFVVTMAARAVWNFRRDHKPAEELPEDIPAMAYDRGLEDILPRITSDTDREILTAVYDRQDTMVELAGDLGCAPDTLRQRLKRAKTRLKRALDENT